MQHKNPLPRINFCRLHFRDHCCQQLLAPGLDLHVEALITMPFSNTTEGWRKKEDILLQCSKSSDS